jgi:hypothetical protein
MMIVLAVHQFLGGPGTGDGGHGLVVLFVRKVRGSRWGEGEIRELSVLHTKRGRSVTRKPPQSR